MGGHPRTRAIPAAFSLNPPPPPPLLHHHLASYRADVFARYCAPVHYFVALNYLVGFALGRFQENGSEKGHGHTGWGFRLYCLLGAMLCES